MSEKSVGKLPWKREDCWILDADGKRVFGRGTRDIAKDECGCGGMLDYYGDTAHVIQQIKRIVTAVNNHKPLVKAVKDFLCDMDDMDVARCQCEHMQLDGDELCAFCTLEALLADIKKENKP